MRECLSSALSWCSISQVQVLCWLYFSSYFSAFYRPTCMWDTPRRMATESTLAMKWCSWLAVNTSRWKKIAQPTCWSTSSIHFKKNPCTKIRLLTEHAFLKRQHALPPSNCLIISNNNHEWNNGNSADLGSRYRELQFYDRSFHEGWGTWLDLEPHSADR